MSDYAEWLNFAQNIALAAGKIVFSLYDVGKKTTFKTGLDGRPATITEADTKSEQLLADAIKNQFPDHGIFGEEGTNIFTNSEYVWYLDPLDGTTNFWRHIPLFGISVGLAFQKKPILGVLYFPALSLMIGGCEGAQALANGKVIHVSERPLKKSLYYLTTAEVRDGLNFPTLAKSMGWVKSIDASSFEFAQIAQGDAELYTFKGISPHDMVAGAAIVEAAGGRVTDDKNQPWTVDSDVIIASNGLIHEEALKLIGRTCLVPSQNQHLYITEKDL